jgi:hypothetical protein
VCIVQAIKSSNLKNNIFLKISEENKTGKTENQREN